MIGEKLKSCRKRMGMTQEQVAESLHVDRTTYTKYETGQSLPSIPMLRILTKLYEVDYNYLLSEPL